MASALRQFLGFLRMEGEGAAGPEAVVRPPRPPRILPRTLTEAQVEALLAAPDLHTPLGVRDRAWIELLYASGPAGFGAGRPVRRGPSTLMKGF